MEEQSFGRRVVRALRLHAGDIMRVMVHTMVTRIGNGVADTVKF